MTASQAGVQKRTVGHEVHDVSGGQCERANASSGISRGNVVPDSL